MQESAIQIAPCGQYLPDETREDIQVTKAPEAKWSQTASVVEMKQNKRCCCRPMSQAIVSDRGRVVGDLRITYMMIQGTVSFTPTP